VDYPLVAEDILGCYGVHWIEPLWVAGLHALDSPWDSVLTALPGQPNLDVRVVFWCDEVNESGFGCGPTLADGRGLVPVLPTRTCLLPSTRILVSALGGPPANAVLALSRPLAYFALHKLLYISLIFSLIRTISRPFTGCMTNAVSGCACPFDGAVEAARCRGCGGSPGSRAAGPPLMTRSGLQGCGAGACLEALQVQKVTRQSRDRLPASQCSWRDVLSAR
jgi:hypothetical protein